MKRKPTKAIRGRPFYRRVGGYEVISTFLSPTAHVYRRVGGYEENDGAEGGLTNVNRRIRGYKN